jgi:hypothetical protein
LLPGCEAAFVKLAGLILLAAAPEEILLSALLLGFY